VAPEESCTFGPTARPFGRTTKVSIVCVAFSVTASSPPSGPNATCAASTPVAESGRVDLGMLTSVSSSVIRSAWIVSAPWFRT